MIYSCAYWKGARNLDQAQEKKLDLICKKLHLGRGMSLLDIGGGWGGFAEFAAKKYGVKVTAITPAKEQVKLAKKRVKGLDVRIMQRDYRDMRGQFDRIVSVGMLEHVGTKNYRSFFEACNNLLKDDGLMLHHFIASNRSLHTANPWTDKYIFPGGVLPSLKQISKAIERKFIVEDIENFGPYYDKTLMAWHANFVKHYPEIKGKYNERFFRMWTFYLLASAGMFRARQIQLLQIVMRKPITSPVYKRI
jgi:cyclopropane-fatty-acyl-phospholipid synthase